MTKGKSLKNVNPGPGSYSPQRKSRQQSPMWRIGTSDRQKWVTTKTPGPGHYKNKIFLDSQKEKSPGYYFGVKIIHKPINPDIPGPGSYNVNSGVGQAPSFSLGGKSPDFGHKGSEKGMDAPGPGFYDITNMTTLNSKGTKIGNSRRDQYELKKDIPGPGKYEVIQFKRETPMFSFGSNERKPNYLSQTTSNLMNIGPGSYDLRSTLRLNMGNTMTPKRQDNTAQIQAALPGPGAYEPNVNHVKKKLPEYRIGSSERSKSPKNYVPGPGKYEPISKIVYQTSPNFRIGSSQRPDLNLKTPSPGPAAYSQTNYIYDKSPRAKRQDKATLREVSQTPGPDKYNVNINLSKERSYAFKIGQSHRDFVRIEKNPGPGSYSPLNQTMNRTTQYSFGKDNRIKPTYRDDLPGPGAYYIKSFVNDFPTFVLPKDDR